MTTCYLAPDPIQDTFFIPGGNTPGNGVQLFCYLAGTTTKQTVYKDNAGATAWTNPIVLDSGGNLPSGSSVWIPTGVTMKFVYAPSTDTDPPASPYRTLDDYAGINDVAFTAGTEWINGSTPVYVGATQLIVSGDQTATLTAKRRIKTTNTGGTIYSAINNATFVNGSTTINVVNDSGSLDAGLSALAYGLFNPANPSIDPQIVYRKGASIASIGGGTTDIWSANGDYVHITGTNAINHFSTAPYAGAAKTLIFDNALSLNHNIPNINNHGANVTTAANDTARVRADTISTYVVDFSRASGVPHVSSQVSNLVYAGPSSGPSAPAAFRALSAYDGAAWVLLDTQVAANTSQVNMTTGISSAFNEYELRCRKFQTTSNNVIVGLRLSLDGGVSFMSGSQYDDSSLRSDQGSGVSAAGSGGASFFGIFARTGMDVARYHNSIVTFYDPADTLNFKHANWRGIVIGAAAGTTFPFTGGGRVITTSPWNALSVFPVSGNISTATFELWGKRY